MRIFKQIQDETFKSQEEIFQHKYSNNILEYQSFLRGFNRNLFSLFKSHYDDLKVGKSISLNSVINGFGQQTKVIIKINTNCFIFLLKKTTPQQGGG